jgi:hypothetical protein
MLCCPKVASHIGRRTFETAAGFPAYAGEPDMFRVHKFMTITKELSFSVKWPVRPLL